MSKLRVLMLEDDEPIRRLAGIILERLNCEVVSTDAGGEALRLYQEALQTPNPFRLVILDLTVTDGRGGREIIAPLRAMDPNVCAVISTGDSSDPLVDDFQDLGFKGLVLKPYRVQDLKEMIVKLGLL